MAILWPGSHFLKFQMTILFQILLGYQLRGLDCLKRYKLGVGLKVISGGHGKNFFGQVATLIATLVTANIVSGINRNYHLFDQ